MRSEVIALADAEARRQGHDLRKFKRPKARYSFVERDGSWWVFYEGKVATFGNHFSVTIDDKTKKAWSIPGR